MTTRRKTWRLLARRVTTVVALAAYLVTALGIPLPAVEAKDTSQPFPCQDHACGCRTADQCWNGCCCFTPAQRDAWAAAHGITPPASTPTSGWRTTRARDRDAAPKPAAGSCCSPKPTKRGSPKPSTGTCCEKNAPADTDPVRWVLVVDALRCQGHGTAWVAAGAALPPPARLTWQPYPDPAGWVESSNPVAFPVPARPSVPPPRS